MSKSAQPCQGYRPLKSDPIICNCCRWSWGAHTPDVRSVFTKISSPGIVAVVEHRFSYTSQSHPDPCTEWRPISYGEDLKICSCGRLFHEHNLRVQMRSKERDRPPVKPESSVNIHIPESATQCRVQLQIGAGCYILCLLPKDHLGLHKHSGKAVTAEWDAEKSTIVRHEPERMADRACGNFSPKVDGPGTCRWCNRRYTDHQGDARGRHLEELTHLHMQSCKCVVNVGSACSCIVDTLKQQILDSMVGNCPEYRPRGGETHTTQMCVCGKQFYKHAEQARGGFTLWSEWRAIRMTNQEVIDWFVGLGKTPVERMVRLKDHLEHPSSVDPYAPPIDVVEELYQMLPMDYRELVEIQRKPRLITTLVKRTTPVVVHKPGCLGSATCNCAPPLAAMVAGVALTPSQVNRIVDPDEPKDANGNRLTCFSCGDKLTKEEVSICRGCVDLQLGHADWSPQSKPPRVHRLHTEPPREGTQDDFM